MRSIDQKFSAIDFVYILLVIVDDNLINLNLFVLYKTVPSSY